jgi:hypothetical protein
MGDGQHIWAAAEWVLIVRNSFVREEEDRLVIGSGVPEEWHGAGTVLRLGPTPTPFGPVTVEVLPHGGAAQVRWQAAWRGPPPQVDVALPGCEAITVDGGRGCVTVRRAEALAPGQGAVVRP